MAARAVCGRGGILWERESKAKRIFFEGVVEGFVVVGDVYGMVVGSTKILRGGA